MASCKMFGALMVTLFALSAADSFKRDVHTKLYPDCAEHPECNKMIFHNGTSPNATFPNLVYVRSAAGKDVLHFVMTTINLPSILVVHTAGDEKQQLSFDWDRLLNGSSADMKGAVYSNGSLYHGHIMYSFVLTFSRLFEYNDIHDEADLNTAREKLPKSMVKAHNFTEFVWMNVTKGKEGQSVIFNTTHPQPEPFGNNSAGSMYFEFEINSAGGRDSDLPRLIYNANNTQMNFVLDNYVPLFNKSRFALEMSVVANHSSQPMFLDETRSIDDEFSPGVFQVVNWYSAHKVPTAGYVQWKPVCYMAEGRSRGDGTEARKYSLEGPANVTGLLKESLAAAFFGKSLEDSSKVVQNVTYVSFGLSQDGFYNKNNYTAWTASVGYGQPPVESISTLVIIIIAAGLGVPVIIILFGGVYVCLRRRRSRGGYEDLSRNNPRLN